MFSFSRSFSTEFHTSFSNSSAAKSYRRSFIETEGGLKNVFANKIFCGWDYNIATKGAADLKIKAIYNELKVNICVILSSCSRKANQINFKCKIQYICM